MKKLFSGDLDKSALCGGVLGKKKKKKRRHRTIFTSYQLEELEKAFKVIANQTINGEISCSCIVFRTLITLTCTLVKCSASKQTFQRTESRSVFVSDIVLGLIEDSQSASLISLNWPPFPSSKDSWPRSRADPSNQCPQEQILVHITFPSSFIIHESLRHRIHGCLCSRSGFRTGERRSGRQARPGGGAASWPSTGCTGPW